MMNERWLFVALIAGLAAAGCGDLSNVKPGLTVRYAPDGTLVVMTADAIDVYDATLAKQMAHIPTPHDEGSFENGNIFSLSDDGTVAAMSDYDAAVNRARILLFSIPDRTPLPPVDLGPPPPDQPQTYAPEDLALSPHGDLVYVMGGTANDYRKTAMFETATGTMLWSSDWATAPAFSPDESRIVVNGDHGGSLLAFDPRSGAPLWTAPVTVSTAQTLSWTSDPYTLVGLFGTTIQLVSSDDGSVRSQFPATSATEVLFASLLPGARAAFRCSAQAGLCAVPVAQIVGVDHPAPDAPPQPRYGGVTRVKVWSLSGVLEQDLATLDSGVFADLAISADGQYLATAYGNGNVRVFRMSDGSLVNSHHYSGSVFN